MKKENEQYSEESIELQILRASFWEHEKAEKDLAWMYRNPNHPKRLKMNKTRNELSAKINELIDLENKK